MQTTNQDYGFGQLMQLLPAEGEFCPLARRTKLRDPILPLALLQQELQHRRLLMELFAAQPDKLKQLSELVAHLSDPGLAHWDQVEELSTVELFDLKSFLHGYLRLVDFLKQQHLEALHPLPDLHDLFSLLDPEGNGLPVFRLSPLYSQRLQTLNDERVTVARKLQEIRNRDLKKAQQELQMPTLKEDFLLSRNQEKTIELLQKSQRFLVAFENLDNIAFSLADSDAAHKARTKLAAMSQAIRDEERNIQKKLSQPILNSLARLRQARTGTLEIVWDYMLSAYGTEYHCCIPTVYEPRDKFPGIHIKAGVYLPLKLHLDEQQRDYQALDLDFSSKISLITGPNMGGKSTVLQSLGLFCTCAARGIPVSASSALLPVFEHCYYNHESSENSENLSSFGREVVSFNTALQHPERTLFLLDEFAKGTNPAEGEALSLATLSYLQQHGYILVAATHFSAPAKLKGISHYSIRGISSEDFCQLEQLPKDNLDQRLQLLSRVMDYSLIKLPKGKEPPQCALQIASLLGLPQDILEKANKHLQKE